MQEAIKNLQNSALFNLSLTSKELFHSNFLFWLANKYKLEIGTIFANKFNLNVKNKILSETPKREQENIDLLLEYDNAIIIIENKVKSIPNFT